MTLTPGSRLGPYTILGPLGAGGMGEVFRARDERLGRDVAIKSLPAGFAQDPERLARFEREAKLLASVSHPTIAGIHGVEERDGDRFLILEFVEGETLGERLRRGPLPLEETLEVARQIATALEVAHESGIVHRDLKPGNVMLTPSGAVKVLDFGLAKSGAATGQSSSDMTISASPTMTYQATAAGVILGTAAYMSPEQARGKAVDRRSDIWSFGCVVFECLTAKPVFEGETISDLVAQILRGEPDWTALPASTPSALRRLIERCLRKDAHERLRDIGDARLELAEIDPHGPAMAALPVTIAPRATPRWPMAVAAAALVALASGIAWVATHRAPPPSGVLETSIMLHASQRLARGGDHQFLALSPDARAVAYVVGAGGPAQLHIRRLDRREDTVLAGTADAHEPFFSPDGDWLAYFDASHLEKISVHGGAPTALATVGESRGGTWLDDGSLVLPMAPTTGLFRLSRDGGEPDTLTRLAPGERTHRWPSPLAGGPWVVYTVGLVNSPDDYDGSDIAAVNVKSGEHRILLHGARRAVWMPPNHLVFDREGTLFAVACNPRNPRVSGDPVPVLDNVGGAKGSGATFLDVARDGTMAWIPFDPASRKLDVGWFDRSGHWTPTPVPPGAYGFTVLSPDGRRAILLGQSELWLADLATGATRQIAFGRDVRQVMWTPDGTAAIITRPDSTGGSLIERLPIDGSADARVIRRMPLFCLAWSQTPDGREIAYSDWSAVDGRMHITDATGATDTQLPTDANDRTYEGLPMLSPDGAWIAFVSNRTGRQQLFVRRRDGRGGLWQVSTDGGTSACWGRGGRELFYIEDQMLRAVTLSPSGEGIALGKPVTLFAVPSYGAAATGVAFSYDPRNDRFLFPKPPAGTDELREIAVSIGFGRRLDAIIREKQSKQ